MTEHEYTDLDDDPGAPLEGRRPLGLLSMVAGAALCAGAAWAAVWWASGLDQRRATDLPVFRASLEPAKVRPEDPGGDTAPYQDLRSFDVASGQHVAAAEIHLAPAPAAPAEEDVAMAELDPASVTDAVPAAAPEVFDERPEGAAEASTGAPPVPMARPRDLARRNEVQSQQAIDEAAQLAARAALSPVQIQLGAYTDRDFTESEWRRIAAGNDDILAGRALAIQSTVSGGQKYWRLRVGPFSDRAEANGVCEALKARGHDCLVAVNG